MKSSANALSVAVALALGIGAAGCYQSPPEIEVDFTKRTPTTFAHHRATPLRVVIDRSVVPPGASRHDLATLAHKLASALARSAEVAFVRSSGAVVSRLESGAADLAFAGLAASAGSGAARRSRVVATARARKGAATQLVVIARPGVDQDERARWSSALSRLHEQLPNMATLARLSIARFVAPRVAP